MAPGEVLDEALHAVSSVVLNGALRVATAFPMPSTWRETLGKCHPSPNRRMSPEPKRVDCQIDGTLLAA